MLIANSLLNHLSSGSGTVGVGGYYDGHAVGLSHLLTDSVEVANAGNGLSVVDLVNCGAARNDELIVNDIRRRLIYSLCVSLNVVVTIFNIHHLVAIVQGPFAPLSILELNTIVDVCILILTGDLNILLVIITSGDVDDRIRSKGSQRGEDGALGPVALLLSVVSLYLYLVGALGIQTLDGVVRLVKAVNIDPRVLGLTRNLDGDVVEEELVLVVAVEVAESNAAITPHVGIRSQVNGVVFTSALIITIHSFGLAHNLNPGVRVIHIGDQVNSKVLGIVVGAGPEGQRAINLYLRSNQVLIGIECATSVAC